MVRRALCWALVGGVLSVSGCGGVAGNDGNQVTTSVSIRLEVLPEQASAGEAFSVTTAVTGLAQGEEVIGASQRMDLLDGDVRYYLSPATQLLPASYSTKSGPNTLILISRPETSRYAVPPIGPGSYKIEREYSVQRGGKVRGAVATGYLRVT